MLSSYKIYYQFNLLSVQFIMNFTLNDIFHFSVS